MRPRRTPSLVEQTEELVVEAQGLALAAPEPIDPLASGDDERPRQQGRLALEPQVLGHRLQGDVLEPAGLRHRLQDQDVGRGQLGRVGRGQHLEPGL